MKDSDEMVKELFERREKYNIEQQRKMAKLKKVVVSLACCIVVIFVVGIPVSNYFLSLEDADSSVGDNVQNAEADYSPSIKKEMPPNNIDDPENADRESGGEEINDLNESNENANDETETANMEGDISTEKTGKDVPGSGSDSLGSTGGLVPYEPVWGDCYQNEAGKWVVFLTENTPENQKKVLELNPTLTENDIIFQFITFSWSYLESLMISIGQAADENEEFSFVSSIGLRTEKNCVEVDVTTDDEESIAKILAFDTIGGGSAIEIVNLNDNAVPEDAQKGPMP